MTTHASPFADRMIEAVRAKGAPLCVGVDIFPERIPALFGDVRADPGKLAPFIAEIIDLAAPRAALLKPQLGFLEPFGPDGWKVLQDATAYAQNAGMLVMWDAKRGDIGSTAEGYARATLGAGADAVTVNAYLGLDSLEPFILEAERMHGAVAILVRTSNPGARDVQDLQADGEPVWAHVARLIAPFAPRLQGESGWSGLMAVAGATWPDEARKLRALMPASLFLVPGYGAQGGGAKDAVSGFIPGPHGLEGGIVSSSRAILYPPGAQQARTLVAWRESVRAAIDSAHAELAAAIGP